MRNQPVRIGNIRLDRKRIARLKPSNKLRQASLGIGRDVAFALQGVFGVSEQGGADTFAAARGEDVDLLDLKERRAGLQTLTKTEAMKWRQRRKRRLGLRFCWCVRN